MSDTPLEFFSDPRKKALDHLNNECFALEQLAQEYGHLEIQLAFFRVRATEISHAATFLRGQIRREVKALEEDASGVAAIPSVERINIEDTAGAAFAAQIVRPNAGVNETVDSPQRQGNEVECPVCKGSGDREFFDTTRGALTASRTRLTATAAAAQEQSPLASRRMEGRANESHVRSRVNGRVLPARARPVRLSVGSRRDHRRRCCLDGGTRHPRPTRPRAVQQAGARVGLSVWLNKY